MNYGSITEAEAYFATRLNTDAWDCLEGAANETKDKTAALTMATKIIDRLNFLGCKTDPTQQNQFPRDAATTVPEAIKEASFEIALALLDGVDPEIEFENLFLISQGYSNVRATFDRAQKSPYFLAGVPSAAAWMLLKPFLIDPNEIRLDRVN